jgi:phage recombination protein Bet
LSKAQATQETTTAQPTTTAPPQEAKSAGAVATISAPRLPYVRGIEERFGIDQGGWRTLVEAIWPAAKTSEAVIMALAYCKSRKLDPFKRPVHIVPVWSSVLNKMVETVWPGISELRTTAQRTRDYAGLDDCVFGPDKTQAFKGEDGATVTLTFPEWAQITVHRLTREGEPAAYVGPKVRWLETYATASRNSKIPNAMWLKRAFGQIEKCAEAAALRRAFPEELGNSYAAEEMEGQVVDVIPRVIPPRPTRPGEVTAQIAESAAPEAAKEEAKSGEKTAPKATPKKDTAAAKAKAEAATRRQDDQSGGDPRDAADGRQDERGQASSNDAGTAQQSATTAPAAATAGAGHDPETGEVREAEPAIDPPEVGSDAWLANQYRALERETILSNVDQLQDAVTPELQGDPARLDAWNKACAARANAIMNPPRKK